MLILEPVYTVQYTVVICANTGSRLSTQPLLSHKLPMVGFSTSGQNTRTIVTNVYWQSRTTPFSSADMFTQITVECSSTKLSDKSP